MDIGISFKPCEICDFDLVLECIAKERNPKGYTKKSQTQRKSHV